MKILIFAALKGKAFLVLPPADLAHYESLIIISTQFAKANIYGDLIPITGYKLNKER